MAYIPYPERPAVPNGWQIAGQALQQGGQQVGNLRKALEEMAAKRAAKILADRAAEDDHLTAEREAAKEKDRLDRQAKADEVRMKIKAGKTIPGKSVEGVIGEDETVAYSPEEQNLMMFGGGGLTEEKFADLNKDKPADPFNDPVLLADYKVKAQQDPSFRQIADGYAKHPEIYGPRLQEWALQNGYSGQRWWAAELGKMYHQPPITPPQAPAFNPQAAKAQKFQQENSFRDEYNKKTEKFDVALPAFGKLQQALQRNNPTDAYAAVINFVRTLDPGSTVKEAEEKLARMRSAGGVWGQFAQNFYNMVDGKMTDDVRKNLYEAGKGLIEQEHDQYTNVRNDYRTLTLNNADPTGAAASLDTLNTIGRGRDPVYNAMITKNIFGPQATPGAPKVPTPIKKTLNAEDRAARKVANQILSNPKSTESAKATAREALKVIGEGE